MADTFQFSLNAIRFEDVRTEIVRYLSENGTYDAPLDFTGSNLAYIIDTMAYTTMLMSYMLSTVANDNFLDTTTLRKNAVSIAKTLGYKPKRIQSSRLEGVFTYNPGDQIFNEDSKIVIPANTVFLGEEYGHSWINTESIYLFVNPKNPFELTSLANEVQPRVSLVQGEYKKFTKLGTGQSLQSFVIPSTKIDENNMEVSIFTTSSDEATKVQWTHAKTFFDIKSDEIYFVEEDIIQEGCPKIIFGNGTVGRVPSNYETIVVDYIETVGAEANNEVDIEIPDTLVPNRSYDIQSVDVNNLSFEPAGVSFGGTEYETLESIKANAPRFFATAGRAVTANDYNTLITSEFGYLVDEANVIGGDELEPGNSDFLGNSYISVIPKGTNDSENFKESLQLYLTEADETEIINKLRDAGIIATKKYFLKPSYIYLDITPNIEVSSRISASELKETEEKAYEILVDYFNEEFKGFGVPYRNSKVRSQVDALETIISTDIDTNYNFVLNRDTFYIDRETVLWLPVKYARSEGQIVRNDWNNLPITTNFVKTNTQIISDNNNNSSSLIELLRITPSTINGDESTIDIITPVWHGRDIEEKYTDHFWTIKVSDAMVSSEPDTDFEWDIMMNDQSNTTLITIGKIYYLSNGTIEIEDLNEYDDGSTLYDINEFLRDYVEVNTEFIVDDADPVNGISYYSVKFRRKFNKYNLLPEEINNNVVGRTSIHGKLSHDNLFRYLYNNDVYEITIVDLNIIDDSLLNTTYTFDGVGTNNYTVSMVRKETIQEDLTITPNIEYEIKYNILLNNTVSEEKKTISSLSWYPNRTGADQFALSAFTENFQWITDQGFEIETISSIGGSEYHVLKLTEDDSGTFHLNITLKSAVSAVKVNEKNLLCAFTYDESATEIEDAFTYYDFYTRTFRNTLQEDIAISVNKDSLTQNTIFWEGNELFSVTYTGAACKPFVGAISSTDDDINVTSLGLRKDIIIEPYQFVVVNELGETETKLGFGVFAYGIYHDSTLGFFEYESGKLNFKRKIEGNYNGPEEPISVAQTHIRDYFNNYGILINDIKMDIIALVPNNDYEEIDGFETIVGSVTDFDPVFTQTVRANINQVNSVQI